MVEFVLEPKSQSLSTMFFLPPQVITESSYGKVFRRKFFLVTHANMNRYSYFHFNTEIAFSIWRFLNLSSFSLNNISQVSLLSKLCFSYIGEECIGMYIVSSSTACWPNQFPSVYNKCNLEPNVSLAKILISNNIINNSLTYGDWFYTRLHAKHFTYIFFSFTSSAVLWGRCNFYSHFADENTVTVGK